MKAQISVFMIIGILVIIAFGITLYVGGKLRDRIETKPTQQRLEQLGAQPLNDYISTCLSLAASDGLSLIGKQGGIIYNSQGGITPDIEEGIGTTHIKYDDEKFGTLTVPFNILPPTGNVGELFYSTPPLYPFETFPYIPIDNGKKTLFTGYYGTSNLAPLYKTTPEGTSVQGSMQETLEQYIAKNTVECANWNSFEEKGYHVTAGDAITTLLFAEKQEHFTDEQFLTIQLLWPIEVTMPSKDKMLLNEFAVRLPVRFATIYYTVKKIIDSDVTDITFTPDTIAQFIITKMGSNEYNLISLKDQQSTLLNQPYEFRIPRKNRIPALWQIDTAPISQATFHITPEGRGATITIENNLLSINDPCQEPEIQNPFLIQLNASDPDEDKVSFEVHIPQSTNNEIPQDAIGFPFSITVYAKDNSALNRESFDNQEIPLQIAQCEVR